jgi:hypothetical protein
MTGCEKVNKYCTLYNYRTFDNLSNCKIQRKGRVLAVQLEEEKKIYDLVAYLGKQHVNAAENVTPKQGTVLKLIRKMEVMGHRLLMDNYFSLPALFFRAIQQRNKQLWYTSTQQRACQQTLTQRC